ncbi:SDR family NAD(P)-dependent oxidoreductase [Tenacibaculum sp. C7A-26P2]|uniref:SDR family NAD(P)-dependent oxidoreductase n=1 Tax=Tenacibaculum sp. C7A-26P2 TaxID=3447504 RepID=UPI003F83606D
MDIVIITGGSNGIGKALAQKYASKKYKVFSFSRSKSGIKNITEKIIDLSDILKSKTQFTLFLNNFNSKKIKSLHLINNVARIGTIANIENIDSGDILKSINLNITLPILLSKLFIEHTKEISCQKKITNISSGAAIKPYEGWSIYCASKAALDMFTKTIASEQTSLKNGVKCIALYPGVVDTNMQKKIRETKEINFSKLQRFINLKKNNELFTPYYVAETIYKIIDNDELKNGSIFDIRDF